MEQQGSNLSQKAMMSGGAIAVSQVVLAGVAWSQAETMGTMGNLALTGVAVVAIGGWLAQSAFLKSKVFMPMNDIVKAMKGLSSGQLSTRMPDNLSGEMAELSVAMKDLANFMKQLHSQLDTAATKLQGSSSGITGGASKMGKNISESNALAAQIATAMDEMSATAREVSGHASRAADQTHAMNDAVNIGQKSMGDATGAIDRLSSQMDLAVDTVRKLAEDSSSVGKVLSVIRGIAEQTNLLALNAAIEAARAGEQGRGFAVVADEVRSLAQKTQESTQEIQVIIENVQNGAKNATSVIDSSKALTTETSGLFSDAGGQLGEIRNSIGELNSLNTHVARAVDEQTRTADSISHDVNRIAEMAESFKVMVEDISRTSNELTSLANSNSEMSRKFS